MPVFTDAGSVNELSSRLSCMPRVGIEYQPVGVRLVASANGGRHFCLATFSGAVNQAGA